MSGRRQAAAPPDQIQVLILALTGEDAVTREAAGSLLWQHGALALPALLCSAAEWLRVPGFRQPEPASEERRAEALFAVMSTIKAIDTPTGVQTMRMVLADRSEDVRRGAVTLLEETGQLGFLALEEALDDGSEPEQEEAAWALGRLGRSEAVAALSQALGSPRPALQSACAHALFNIALRDPVPELRLAARRLEELARFGADSPLPVRDTCRQTLQQINAVTRPHPSLPIPAIAGQPEASDLPLPHYGEGDHDV